MTSGTTNFTMKDAVNIARDLGIDWASSKVDIQQFLRGLNVELEHGSLGGDTDVTHDDPIVTGKIALAHLNECPDYYTRLARMETEADALSHGPST